MVILGRMLRPKNENKPQSTGLYPTSLVIAPFSK